MSKNRTATLHDVARLAGVSVSTASRALNGYRNVDEDLVSRVRQAAAELNYSPNPVARSLRLSRTMTLGVILTRLDSPIPLEVLEGVDAVCQEHGYSLLVMNAADHEADYEVLVPRLHDRRVDGLFVYLPGDIDAAVAPLQEAGIPVLALSSRRRGSSIPLVTNYGGRSVPEAIGRLAELGHRSIVYVSGSSEIANVRAGKLEEASHAAGIQLVTHFSQHEHNDEAMVSLLRDAVTGPEAPTVLLTEHRQVTRALDAIESAGLRVPDDLSFVVFGDSQWLRALRPQVSTIRMDNRELGRSAARLMLEWLDGAEPPLVTYGTAAEWVERASVGPVPVHALAR